MLASLLLAVVTSNQVDGKVGRQLDAQLTRFAAYGFSGTVLVVREGRVVLLKGYGLADVNRGVPNSADTRFEMNSMTKMFTGVSILQLAAAGKITPNDLVARHLGEFPLEKRGATIEQLASHTSGLIVEGAKLAEDSRDAFVRDVKQSPRESAPGERYRYTNAGFSVLAAIIEIVSGQSYETYLRQHIFAPAHMLTATFRDEVPPDDSRFAHGYVGTPASLQPGPPNPYVWGTRGAGGVWTTVGDIYRWLVAVEDGVVLPKPERAILFSPPKPPAKEAFGWHVDAIAPDGRLRIEKGGGSDDFASQLLYYRKERVAIIWASNNLRQRWRQALNRAIPAIVFGGSDSPLPPIANLSDRQLARHAGAYTTADGEPLTLRVANNYLFFAGNVPDGLADAMFFPQDASHFTAFDPVTRSFTRLEFEGDGFVLTLANGKNITTKRTANIFSAPFRRLRFRAASAQSSTP